MDNNKCDKCESQVDWIYLAGDSQYCDTCVPRGCECNQDEDGTEYLDDKGRKLPCCEFWLVTEPIDVEVTDGED